MDKIIKLLVEKKLSKTKVRVEILSLFTQAKKPLSVFDLKKIKALKEVNDSSLYRNLKKLEEVNLIQAVPSSNEYQFYEFVSQGSHHHHHIICSECDEVVCLTSCSIEKELEKMAEKVGFSLTGHSLELKGQCPNCRVG